MTNEEAITRLKGLYGNGYSEQEQALDMAIRALKNEQTNGELISRQAVKNLIRSLTKWSVRSQDRKFENVGLLYDDVMFGIDRLPSAEQTAEWKLADAYRGLYTCSNCRLQSSKYAFCPQCGARMKESGEE